MGSSSKKKEKDKESRKRRHRDSYVEETYEAHKEKRHKHKHKHHKKRSKHSKPAYQSDDSDVVEIIDSPPPTPQTSGQDKPHHENVPQEKSPSPVQQQHPPAPPPRVEPPRPAASRAEPPRQAPPKAEPPRQPPPRAETPRQAAPRAEQSPEPQRQHTESLSIDETNRLRAKLGLKPLEVGSSRAESSSGSGRRDDGGKDEKRKDDLGEFYHRPAENWKDKAQQEKIRDKIREQKEKRQLHNKLSKVKLLADGDSDDDAAASWVEKSRRIEQQRLEADKRAKMLEELDEQFGISEVIETEERHRKSQQYTGKNLKGLRVEHDMTSFKDERTTILTLKDKGVLDEDDDDVLVNVNMVDDERYKKNVENKKKKVLYNAYEDDEFDEFGNPREKSLLAQYDEEIDGVKKDSFIIGQEHSFDRRPSTAQSVKDKLAKKKIETLATKGLQIASDYYTAEEMATFKKPKKKVRKIRAKGKLTADALEEINNKGIESVGSRRPKYKNDPGVFDIDDVPAVNIPTDMKLEDEKDDGLERALHKARKLRQKENVVAELLSSTEVKMEPVEEDASDAGNNIILNSTAEFCRTLGDIPTYGKSGNREDNEEVMDFDADDVKEETLGEEAPPPVVDPERSGWNSVDPNAAREIAQIDPQEIQILDEEPDVSAGVGAALKLAMSKGYLDKEQKNRPSNSRLAHLQAQHYSIEDKTYGEEGDRQGRRERYAGPLTEFRERGDFKPNVKLEYIDDEGHILNSKEAFRYLSHKFHGKGPGKNKIEKRIKKNLQEQLMKKMSSTDTPLGTLNMLQAKQKETHSAFVVLSGSKQTTVIAKTNRR